tara:strand:+ start:4205 stop:4447 length:243 start_codon:yes stop_codon:yes gene_type:complete
MKVKELLEDDSWLDIAKDKLSAFGDLVKYGPQDPMDDYRAFIKKNIRQYGSQKTYRMLKKTFPKAAPTDLQKAMRLEIGA